jgi:hypothetical protein
VSTAVSSAPNFITKKEPEVSKTLAQTKKEQLHLKFNEIHYEIVDFQLLS